MSRITEELPAGTVQEPELDAELPSTDDEILDPLLDEEDSGATGDDDDDLDDEDDDEVVVVIGKDTGDDEEVHKAPKWVKELRKADREKAKRIKELEDQLKVTAAPKPQVKEPGAKPTLKGLNYDEAKFEAELTNWHDQRAKYKQAQEDIANEEAKRKSVWDSKVETYQQKKKALKIKDFAAVEGHVKSQLSKVQFGMIIDGAENPAIVVAALNANPTQLDRVAKIANPVKFAFAVSKLETQMRVKARKPSTDPERVVRGKRGASVKSGEADRKLNTLREEAARTGNYTKVREYKRIQKQKK